MKSSDPLVSIIIPVYNGSNYLKEAIDSALGQTYPNIEVLVINDGSSDNGKTEQVAKIYGNKIRYLLKKNGGVATALNYGIEKMKGEWFAWLSHDDIYEPYKISELVKYIDNHPDAKILYTDYQLVNEKGAHLHDVSVKPKKTNNMQLRLIDSYPLNGCAMLIKKECFDKVGNFDESLRTTQDYDLWFRLSKHYNYDYVPISSIRSRLHSEQGSHTYAGADEADNLYLKIIKQILLSEIKKEYGNKSISRLLHVVRVYKGRGYAHSSIEAIKKAKLISDKISIDWIYTRIYCSIPVSVSRRIILLRQKLEKYVFGFTGKIKKLLKKMNKITQYLRNTYKYFWVISATYTFISVIKGYFKFSTFELITKLDWYLKNYNNYQILKNNTAFKSKAKYFYPCLDDKTTDTPIEPIYFYQNSWAASKLFELKPKKHVDVGSSASAIGIISQYVPTTMVDIRPLEVRLNNLTFIKGSILKLPFKDNSLETISSICVVEHIGLGRYGDKLDGFGSEKAIKELCRVVKRKGYIIISVPVDVGNRVYFNAHRAFARNYILELFSGFTIVEEKYIYGYDMQNNYDASLGFGTGL
ncbi:hypothetical protein COX08_01135 [Candidatus Beckwithbacteria bacterium CG23_combo_of_CG06-09_8_20_14_all_34_8]|uniref:Glycosyltransferase 2-like domain-containing protein n=1 Tax=Candidatus Beckwithbacteria bacterium CG23_combo_of_CG06-09_8_20_14_all_34_8 TaxID=1974497 RepID=A0A2H0B8M6_9BACT|nr:MAG: hypothetical protein COX08_01135 [Candidatus Beckwithbacteria bacterium CG23_combo_of_CG06-09_8_20_14_all_34_8]